MTGAEVENAWKNVRFRPHAVARPHTRDELLAVLAEARAHGRAVRAVGGAHSFNHIFRTDGILLDLRHLAGVVSIDENEGTAEFEAGTTVADAITALDGAGLHFPSLGSWYSQSLAGAIATSTHGSSLTHGSLSDAVTEVEAVVGDGRVVRFAGEDDSLKAMRAHLGELGVLTRIKMRFAPAFWLSCTIRSEPDVDAFRAVVGLAREHEYVNMLWLPNGEEACTRILSRSDARQRSRESVDLEKRFVGRGHLANTAEDLGVFLLGHAYLRAPRLLAGRYSDLVRRAFVEDDGVVDKSYRVFLYDQYREPTENHCLRMIMNAEYAIDVGELEAVMFELKTLVDGFRSRGRHLNYPRIHVRFAPSSDRTLIGLNADRDTAYVGTYIVGSIRHASQIELAEAIERVFIAHHGRPHWGKYRYVNDDGFTGTYPKLPAFEAVRRALDPQAPPFDPTAMFAGLDRFLTPPRGRMLRSLFDRDTYAPVRLL